MFIFPKHVLLQDKISRLNPSWTRKQRGSQPKRSITPFFFIIFYFPLRIFSRQTINKKKKKQRSIGNIGNVVRRIIGMEDSQKKIQKIREDSGKRLGDSGKALKGH